MSDDPYSFYSIIPASIKSRLQEYRKIGVIQRTLIPASVQQERPHFSLPVLKCLLFNSPFYTTHLLESDGKYIMRVFIDQAEESRKLTMDMKTYLVQNVVLYLLLIFLSPSETELYNYIQIVVPDDKQSLMYFNMSRHTLMTHLTDFLIGFRKAGGAALSTREYMEAYFNDCMAFYNSLLNLIIQCFGIKMKNVFKITGTHRSYFPRTVIMRLQLVSFLQNSDQILSALHNCHFPRIFPLTHSRPDKKISLSEWTELSGYLPRVPSNPTLSPTNFINKFNVAVYKMSLNPVYLNKAKIDNTQLSINWDDIEPPPLHTLLLQCIVLQFQNWEEIWFKMGWRKCLDLQFRLFYYTQEKNHLIQPKDWLSLLFSDHL